MKVKNISYPYPVLGNEDDVKGVFGVKFYHTLKTETIDLRMEFDLQNETLEKLISNGKAAYFIELECGGTFQRSTHSSDKTTMMVSVPSDKYRDQVVIRFSIRALADIPKYKIAGCHEDYKGFSFSIGKGDMLAQGGQIKIIADKEFDPLQPSVSSFMVIEEGRDKSGIMSIDYFDPDRIVVKLPKEDWNIYQLVKGQKWVAPLIHSSIVLPVLIDAITRVRDRDEDVLDTHWFQRLEVIINEQGLPVDEPLEAAQKILRSPVDRSMKGILERDELDS